MQYAFYFIFFEIFSRSLISEKWFIKSYKTEERFDTSSDFLYKLCSSFECPTCSKKIIDESNFLSWFDRIFLYLDRVLSVFERIICPDSWAWELPFLADHHKWFFEDLCYECSEDKPSCIESRDHICILRMTSKLVSCVPQCFWMSKKWRDIPKEDSGFRKIRITRNMIFESNIREIFSDSTVKFCNTFSDNRRKRCSTSEREEYSYKF